MNIRSVIGAIFTGAALVGSADAQSAPVVPLKAPVTAKEEFTRIVSSRELADGRLLVTDRRENRIALVSFDGAAAVTLSRIGSGPGEYRTAGALVAMPGDSTALADVSNARWLLFAGGNVGGTIAQNEGEARLPAIPVGVTSTNFYGYVYPKTGLGTTAAETLALVRVSRRNRAVDTIARLAAQTARQSAPQKVDRLTVTHISISPWSAGDQAMLFDDGWLAIARVSPYSVDWISPDRKLRRGKSLRASEPPFDESEKRAFLERIARETDKPAEPISSRNDWPAVVTAFTSDSRILGAPSPALLASQRGQLIVRRQPTAAEPQQRYDVIDRSSNVVGQIVLGRRETLIGAGRAHLYSVVTDDDGIQHIRRYDWAR